KLPLSPALLPMTMTAVCGAGRDTSKVGVSDYGKASTLPIAGCLLLEPPTESLLQAPSRSRKAAYACSGRMCPQAPHLRQHRSRPRHLLEVLRSHHVMVACIRRSESITSAETLRYKAPSCRAPAAGAAAPRRTWRAWPARWR